MLKFNGNIDTALRSPLMKEYRKLASPVTAIQQDATFAVQVSWQDTAQAGDGLVSDEGSSWPVAKDIFAATYEHIEGDLYVKTATVMAIQINEPFEVETLEGLARASAGDYLAQGPTGEAWPIPQATFESTYETV
jgi:hypothetical protein